MQPKKPTSALGGESQASGILSQREAASHEATTSP